MVIFLKIYWRVQYYQSVAFHGVFLHSLIAPLQVVICEIMVGPCLPQGITAILNFQTEREHANWGINSESINDSCRCHNILMVNYPIRLVKVYYILFNMFFMSQVSL